MGTLELGLGVLRLDDGPRAVETSGAVLQRTSFFGGSKASSVEVVGCSADMGEDAMVGLFLTGRLLSSRSDTTVLGMLMAVLIATKVYCGGEGKKQVIIMSLREVF